MSHTRRYLVRALVVAALAATPVAAGEVIGDLVCCKKKCNQCQTGPATACFDPCCDPCKVGPIRRFFRGCHRKPCAKPCCPPVPVAVVPACPPPVVAAPVVVAPPPPTLNFAPPVQAPPTAQPVFPSTGSSYRAPGTASPPQIRPDRIASNSGGERFMLVNAEKRTQQQQAAADDDGRFRATLAAGTWHIYGKDVEGKPVYRGKLEVREPGVITVRMR